MRSGIHHSEYKAAASPNELETCSCW